VRLLAWTGHYVSVSARGKVQARAIHQASSEEFIVHTENSSVELRYKGAFFLEHRVTKLVVDSDPKRHSMNARFEDFSEWQRFVIEKVADDDSDSTASMPDVLDMVQSKAAEDTSAKWILRTPVKRRLLKKQSTQSSPQCPAVKIHQLTTVQTPVQKRRAGSDWSPENMVKRRRPLQVGEKTNK